MRNSDPIERRGVGAGRRSIALFGYVFEDQNVAGLAAEVDTKALEIVQRNVLDRVVHQALNRTPAGTALSGDRQDTDPAPLAGLLQSDKTFEMTIHDFHTSLW